MGIKRCAAQTTTLDAGFILNKAWLFLILLGWLWVAAGCTLPRFGPQQTPTISVAPPKAEVTPATVPVIAVAPIAGQPGATVFVSGAGWQPQAVVEVNLVAQQNNTILTRTVLTLTTDAQGQFATSFVYPTDPLFNQVADVQVTALSPATGAKATTAWTVIAAASATATLTTTRTLTTTINLPIVSSPPKATMTPTATVIPPRAPTATRPTQPTNLAHVTSSALNVRRGPALTYDVVRTVQRDAPLTILGQNDAGDWLYVLLSDGAEGWVARSFTDYQQSAPVVAPPQPTSTPTPAIPTLTPAVTPTVITDWRGEYYDNPNLAGAARLVQNDLTIDFNWGDGAPAAGLPVDNFSIRWTRSLNFAADRYRFHAQMDDGLRLYVDNTLVIDEWRAGGIREVTADRSLAQGVHSVRVEYYENSGVALAKVWWESIDATPIDFPDWKGQYWSNRDLAGDPTLVRNDADIDFNWGNDAPASTLPDDNFSARWTRRVSFRAGLYRFSARADDGIRFYLDDELLIDKWQASGGDTVYTVDVALDGRHRLTVEYYEASGSALIEFSWRRLASTTPTPTIIFTPTWTPIPPATPTVPATATFTPTPTLPPTPTLTPTPTLVPSATAPAIPWVTINPSTGGANTTITVSGGGFPANTTVNVHLATLVRASQANSEIKIYATTQTDGKGAYTTTLLMPAKWPDDTPVGDGQLVVIVATNDFTVQASALFGFVAPSATPTVEATEAFTPLPTETPILTETPTTPPTETALPTEAPTATPQPTATPTMAPSPTDTSAPAPTATSTALPTNTPTPLPTDTPTDTPTVLPTNTSTLAPTDRPTDTPTALPTDTPTPLPPPTATPTVLPSDTPTSTPNPDAHVKLSAGNGKIHVIVTGAGFPALTDVELYLEKFNGEASRPPDRQPYATTTTDENGRYTASFILPETWPDGTPLEAGQLEISVAAQTASVEAKVVFDYNPTAIENNALPDHGPR